jgi:type VI secretion system secreted protein VgrG
MPRSQDTCVIAVETALGPDVMLLRRLQGHEAVSELFVYELEMDSTEHRVAYADILGTNATARVVQPGGETRYWNGFITRFRQAGVSRDGLAIYRAQMVPWLWFLTRTADCRMFQNQTVPEIIETVLGDFGFADYRLELSDAYPQREYCVQYRETAFNFLSRLMEEEGIFYYFAHENGRHDLVIADSRSRLGAWPGYEEVPFLGPGASVTPGEVISAWNAEYRVVTGAYAQTDYNFRTPSTSLRTNAGQERSHAQAGYEVYDYPGLYEDFDAGTRYSRTRLEELQWQHEVYRAISNARGIAPGHLLKVTGHPQTAAETEFLVVSAEYRIWPGVSAEGHHQDEEYVCEFSAIKADEPFRPPRRTPKPLVEGPQTAVVVGPAGEEIYTDEYGRVVVQFHWDREGQANENSSCWIRVAQVWAGRNWGAMFLPRIGQEVIVEFLEGNPDRPIITGRVYHAQNPPPYPLPDEKTKSTLKSLSSKGGGGFNEVRFEDKKGQEQLFIHAQKDMDTRVGSQSRLSVGSNLHETVGGEKDGVKCGDRRMQVYQDQHLKVHRNLSEHVGGDMQLQVGGIDGPGNQDIVIKAQKKELVEGDCHHHVKGNRKEKVDLDQSLTVGMNQHEKVGMKHALEAGQEIHLKGGMRIVIEAGMQLSLKGPGGFVDIGPAGVTIQGTLVNINSGGAAGSGAGASPQAPEDPKAASPTAPTVAADAAPGAVSTAQATPASSGQGGTDSVEVQPGGGGEEGEEATEAHWIIIELKDGQGNPVPDEPYRLKLPDGTVQEGRLNSNGKAEIRGITTPGQCQVCFPERDKDDWRPA